MRLPGRKTMNEALRLALTMLGGGMLAILLLMLGPS